MREGGSVDRGEGQEWREEGAFGGDSPPTPVPEEAAQVHIRQSPLGKGPQS